MSQPAFSEGSKVTTTALLAVSILLKPEALSAVEFHRIRAACLRLMQQSIVPGSSNKSSPHHALHHTFQLVAAGCCKLSAVQAARICDNDYRPPTARNVHPPACHSAYQGSPTKSTARCSRHRNLSGNSNQPYVFGEVITILSIALNICYPFRNSFNKSTNSGLLCRRLSRTCMKGAILQGIRLHSA